TEPTEPTEPNKETLPQTGEDNTLKTALTSVGLLVITLVGVLTYRFKFKK
ncbi:LPXTG cell wall anchor domain-containing protein, partial [Enterococcus faecalis]